MQKVRHQNQKSESEMLLLCEQDQLILNLMASTCLKKVGTGSCFPLCGISSFNNICKHLGAEETSCWSFGRGTLSHSCLKEDSSCSAIPGLLWFYFVFAVGESLDYRRPVQHPDSVAKMQYVVQHCFFLKYAEPSLNKTSFGQEHMLL